MRRVAVARCAAQLLAQPRPRLPSSACPYAAANPSQPNTTPRPQRIHARFRSTAAAAELATSQDPFGADSTQEPQATPDARLDATPEASETSGTSQNPILGAKSASRTTRRKLPPAALPSPNPSDAERSAKLFALRSRLTLPLRFPLPVLARTLVDASADPDPAFNNASLALLGRHLLGYYMSEWFLCNYPRLPMEVLFAAVEAYIGPKSLASVAKEWGIEAAAAPGGEVDPGLLQFKRIASGDPLPEDMVQRRPVKWNITTTHRIMNTNEFGSMNALPGAQAPANSPVSMEHAAQSFVRALVGALHVHFGAPMVKRFFRDHFLSRHLDISTIFEFAMPTRDLSRLCAREGFEAPVARLISESGRLSRSPVFVVGVFSGRDKLGEASGSSLHEARVRAAAAALKAWYLYKPLRVTLPSSMEDEPDTSKWQPNYIDCGEVIV